MATIYSTHTPPPAHPSCMQGGSDNVGPRIEVNTVAKERGALVKQLPPRPLERITQDHQQRRVVADSPHGLEVVWCGDVSVLEQIFLHRHHLVALRRRDRNTRVGALER